MTGADVAAAAEPRSAEAPAQQPGAAGGWSPWLGSKAASIRAGWEREPVRSLAGVLIATSFFFMAMPWIDLTISGWFAAPDGSFPLARDETLRAIRDVNRLIPQILLSTMVVIVLGHAFSTRSGWLLRPHLALYVTGVYVVGSGLAVNLLKEIVGRARPEDTIAFGGTAAYTIPWQIAQTCASNCSFSSGEAASAAAMLSCVVLAPGRLRRPLFLALVPLAILFSLLRVAFGKHFISDVVVSWLLVAMLAILLWRLVSTHGEAIDRAVVGSGLPLARLAGQALRKATRGRSTPAAAAPIAAPASLAPPEDMPARPDAAAGLPACATHRHLRPETLA